MQNSQLLFGDLQLRTGDIPQHHVRFLASVSIIRAFFECCGAQLTGNGDSPLTKLPTANTDSYQNCFLITGMLGLRILELRTLIKGRGN